ncbi:unnamed protein product, partial [Mycena citricolor]
LSLTGQLPHRTHPLSCFLSRCQSPPAFNSADSSRRNTCLSPTLCVDRLMERAPLSSVSTKHYWKYRKPARCRRSLVRGGLLTAQIPHLSNSGVCLPHVFLKQMYIGV